MRVHFSHQSSPDHQPLRAGIIGCAGYAIQLIRRIWTLPNEIHLAAAVAPDPDAPQAEECRNRGVRIFRCLENMLEMVGGNLNVILNPSPIHLHSQFTRQCIAAGVPVWLEKPPVVTVEEFESVRNDINRSGIPVDVCFNSLYSFRTQELKKQLVRGDFGAVRRVRSIGAWARPSEYFLRTPWAGKLQVGDDWVYDGTINNPFAHLLCNSLYFASKKHHELAEHASLEARLWHGNPIESEDTSSLRIISRDGVEILTHFTLCPDKGEIPPTTVIDTENAIITFSDFKKVTILWQDGRSEIRDSYKEDRIEMLEFLCRKLRRNEAGLCPFQMTRPFIHAVQASFKQVLDEHNGRIPQIAENQIIHDKSNGSSLCSISGINDRMSCAHDTGTWMHSIS